MEDADIFNVTTIFVATTFLSLLIFIPKPSFAVESYTLAANTFVFDPRSKSYKAISNGKVVKSGRASGGRKGKRTPVGHFRVIRRQGSDCYSYRYRSRMPYCNFFKRLYAIHGHKHVPGYNASNGCIRLPVSDARWLYYNFFRYGTKVIVKPY